ncbi:MAG: hypothetical protein O7G30_04535 [Proteobacteria bacterium]|nr:hypothetical protein [Pseudomonadota bacterium]
MSDRLERALHAYHDRELGWWARNRLEARLRRSPELRAELAALESLGDRVRESEAAVRSPGTGADFWEGIAGRLRAVDAAVEAEGAGPSRALPGWRPLIAAAGVAAAVVALLVTSWVPAPPVAPVEEALASGSVRYLDTGGAAVWVQDRKGVTIIWVMDRTHDEV